MDQASEFFAREIDRLSFKIHEMVEQRKLLIKLSKQYKDGLQKTQGAQKTHTNGAQTSRVQVEK